MLMVLAALPVGFILTFGGGRNIGSKCSKLPSLLLDEIS